jgi:hypothetical protein
VIPRYQCKPADPWISLMMFNIVSGLSIDHEVFLLSRMREEWARSGDNSQAVPSGLASTARVIAAAIMVCVFGSLGTRCAPGFPSSIHGRPVSRPDRPNMRRTQVAHRSPAKGGVTWPASKESRRPKPGCT